MKRSRKIAVNAQMALVALGRIITRPAYIAIILGIAFLFATLIFFIINNAFYGSLLMSRLPFADKIGLIGQMIGQMSVEFFTTANGFLILLVSLLQGIAITLLIYTIRHNRRNNDAATAQQLGTSGLATVAAAIGLGCVPCGTSLLLPIVTIFFSGSAVATAVSTLSIIILVVALVLSIYSIYHVGKIAYPYTEEEIMQKRSAHGPKDK